jgi:cold shock CspA family protein
MKVQAPAKRSATVIMYKPDKSFGFLLVDGHPNDLFFHGSEVRKAGIETASLLRGVKLLCNVGEAQDGRPCAVDLELVGQ